MRRFPRNGTAMKIGLNLTGSAWKILPFDADAKAEARRDNLGGGEPSSDERHLQETVAWLTRAHDAGGDGGVSRAYSAARISQVKYVGWEPSYPETTGYIIPTLLTVAGLGMDAGLKERLKCMADWEAKIQMESGAVMGSVVTANRTPAIFNTGQVIFGWLAAHEAFGSDSYLSAAKRAGDFLVSVQGADGSWTKGNSAYALPTATTYNTRVAWALAALGARTGDTQYSEAARGNLMHALSRQNPSGWFSHNCLSDPGRPLLHTVVYAIRGFLESGVLLREQIFIDAAARALEGLRLCQRADGGLAGRMGPDWLAEADWDCLTGDAQVAGAWLRLQALAGGARYGEAARRAIEFVKRTQNLDHANEGIRGGVKGSFPFDGEYGPYEMLNWAAKFMVDALVMASSDDLAKRGIPG